MGALASQLQARRERLQRFAAAAARYQVKSQPLPPLPMQRPAELTRQRREYETIKHPTIFTPISRRIINAIADEFGLTVREMIGHSRDAKYVRPRHIAAGLMIELTQMSLPAIGRQLGGRDHTTIINSRTRFAVLLESESFRNRVDQIKAGITREMAL